MRLRKKLKKLLRKEISESVLNEEYVESIPNFTNRKQIDVKTTVPDV
jgi:hypothetical protein